MAPTSTTTTTTNSPAILLIPGSFSPPHFYASVATHLQSLGFSTVQTVSLPSVGRRDPTPPASMQDDAREIERAAASLLSSDADRDLVLIPHSYGGIPTTEAAYGIAKSIHDAKEGAGGGDGGSSRGNRSRRRSLLKVIYVTSVVPRVGQSCGDAMGSFPDFLTLGEDYIAQDPVPNAALTFSDLPSEEGEKWARQMPEQSTASFTEQLTRLGYLEADEVGYVVCKQDKIIPPDFQRQMAEVMGKDILEKRGGNGDGGVSGGVVVREIDSGHCVNASQPKELAELLADMIRDGEEG